MDHHVPEDLEAGLLGNFHRSNMPVKMLKHFMLCLQLFADVSRIDMLNRSRKMRG